MKRMKKITLFGLSGFVLLVVFLLSIFYTTFPESSIYVPPSILRILIAMGPDVNDKNSLGFTALHLSSMIGRCNSMKILISCGAKLESQNNQGWTPLHTAIINYRSVRNAVKLLVENGADIEARTNHGETPLIFAAMCNNDPNLVEYLINNGASTRTKDDKGLTPLHHAIESENYPASKALLSSGANVLAESNDNVTPLECALIKKDKRFAKLLIESLGNSQKCTDGKTPLHLVAMVGGVDMAKFLIEKGLDANATDKYGKSPAQLARLYHPPNSEIVKYFESLEK